MNDSNNNTDHAGNIDQDAGSSKPNYTKSNSNRTSDIYERFLNRVQSIDNLDNIDNIDFEIDVNSDDHHHTDSTKRLEKATEPSTYDLLGEEELQLFIDPEPEAYANPNESDAAIISDNSDGSVYHEDKLIYHEEQLTDSYELATDDESAHISDHSNDRLTTEAETELDIEKGTNTKKIKGLKGKSISTGKLLIIGIVFGLLLSTIIVILLTSTGILSNLMSDGSKDTPVSTPVIDNEQPEDVGVDEAAVLESASETQVVAEPSAEQDLSTDTANAEKPVINDADKAASEQKPVSETQTSSEESNNSDTTDAAITYEDFREEAQNTLYRETKD